MPSCVMQSTIATRGNFICTTKKNIIIIFFDSRLTQPKSYKYDLSHQNKVTRFLLRI